MYWYRRKVSGPLFERIDLHIEAESLSVDDLIKSEQGESSEVIRKRVIAARKKQSARYKDLDDVHCNAQMPDSYIDSLCIPEGHAKKSLFKNMDMLQLSARSYTRILKVGRIIADLAGSDIIELPHVAEALHLGSLDKPLVMPILKRKATPAKVYHFAI